MSTNRLHSLDALRACALLLGVVFHSTLSHLLPPGLWAVGTTAPSPFLGWFTFYIHSFRLEVFFLLAGFFGAMVVQKRGVAAYVRDRLKRLLLVFGALLYPMKFALASVWMFGGRQTGWLTLPPEIASTTWWQPALGGLGAEHWSRFQLTHLWFLYYLVVLTGLFLVIRWLIGLASHKSGHLVQTLQLMARKTVAGWSAPIALALLVTPVIAFMKGPDVDTPDQSLALNFPVLVDYGILFALGWWLFGNRDLLANIARRWHWFLAAGVLISLPASIGTGMIRDAQFSDGGATVGFKWFAVSGVGVTMAFSLFGWLGCFIRFFKQPSPSFRYLADSSYWVYVTHLPLIIILQIVLAGWHLPWWIELPLINLIAFAILLASYHFCVRFTWIGAWLNGRRFVRRERMVAPVNSKPLGNNS